VLIGGGTDPVWKYITTNDGTIVTTTGQNTLDIAVATCVDLEDNLVVCDGIRTTGATSISNDATSEGVNIATEDGRAESFNTSSGMNVALRNAIATSTNSYGFNFAAGSAFPMSFVSTATSTDGSAGFNFASLGAKASSSASFSFNFASRGATSSSNKFSDGFNFAAAGGDAISNNNSDGFNFAAGTPDMSLPGGTATSYDRSAGFNFATFDSTATSTNFSNGFNFAAGSNDNFFLSGGMATSNNNSNGFNFAAAGATATSTDNSNGFNFAAEDATATSTHSNGFNFASLNSTVKNSAGSQNGSILFALGANGFSTSSTIDLSTDNNSFTVAVAGAQATDPEEGVNFYINNNAITSPDSNLRFIDLPEADPDYSDESLLVIDNATGSVRISDTTASGVTVSSKRFKNDIESLDNAQAGQLNKLRPVSFIYKKDETNRMQFGLIAEEVAEILPELVTYDKDGHIHGLKYDMLTPLLVKMVQLQQESINGLKRKHAKYAQKNRLQYAQLAACQNKNDMHSALIAECLSRLVAIEAKEQ
jgi:hypothetical protein